MDQLRFPHMGPGLADGESVEIVLEADSMEHALSLLFDVDEEGVERECRYCRCAAFETHREGCSRPHEGWDDSEPGTGDP